MDAAEVAANIKGKLTVTETKSRVSKYRHAMQMLGMVQVNYLVPEDRTKEISLLADKLRAERFIEIVLELEPDHEQRVVLANRNSARYPTHSEIGTLGEQIPQGSPLRGDLKKLTEHVNGALRAAAAMQALDKEGGDDFEFIKWASLVVAHSHMAKSLYDYLQWMAE